MAAPQAAAAERAVMVIFAAFFMRSVPPWNFFIDKEWDFMVN